MTGYSQEELEAQLIKQTDYDNFFAEAPKLIDELAKGKPWIRFSTNT